MSKIKDQKKKEFNQLIMWNEIELYSFNHVFYQTHKF